MSGDGFFGVACVARRTGLLAFTVAVMVVLLATGPAYAVDLTVDRSGGPLPGFPGILAQVGDERFVMPVIPMLNLRRVRVDDGLAS